MGDTKTSTMNLHSLKYLITVFTFICAPFLLSAQSGKDYKLKSKDLTILLSKDGIVSRMWLGKNKVEKELNAYTDIQGSRVQGNVSSRRLKNGGIEFKKTLVNDSLQSSCTLTERFIPTKNSIRWEIEIKGNGKDWGTPVKSVFNYPARPSSRFWTTWAGPQYDKKTLDSKLLQRLTLPEQTGLAGTERWRDPLLPMPFTKATIYYGAPPLNDETPLIPFSPFRADLTGVPMCSILDDVDQSGLTIALAPSDNIIDLVLNTEKNGTVSFTRLHSRISSNTTATYNLDLVAGESDWRDGLGWMADRYPEYFNPVTKDALKFGGLGAYSNYTGELDVPKLKKMGFTVNWQASFDFPYMGMFLPPLKRDEVWTNFRKSQSSMSGMDDYARRMRENGFYVFNYFNVTEFGANVEFPPKPADVNVKPEDRWRNSSRFLYDSLFGGAMRGSDKMNISWYKTKQPGGLFYSWEGCVAMDCGDPAYQRFLLKQAMRHIEQIPNSFGICIDRMDWLRLFNQTEDDGIAWYNGKPARSLITSWKQLMEKLGPMMHNNGKSILVNNHDKRIDLMNHIDGIFDEFTYDPSPLNLTSLLCVYKPALGWTHDLGTIKNAGIDNFFQKYLYMGVYPMFPYKGNDHAIQPSKEADDIYMRYIPLLAGIKNRTWILKPHVISVKNEEALANIFSVPKGYAIPVVYAKQGIKEVEITLRNIDISAVKSCLAYHPGKEKAVSVPFIKGKDHIKIKVPVEQGCAMVIAETK